MKTILIINSIAFSCILGIFIGKNFGPRLPALADQKVPAKILTVEKKPEVKKELIRPISAEYSLMNINRQLEILNANLEKLQSSK